MKIGAATSNQNKLENTSLNNFFVLQIREREFTITSCKEIRKSNFYIVLFIFRN